jgi:hypothetical protein
LYLELYGNFSCFSLARNYGHFKELGILGNIGLIIIYNLKLQFFKTNASKKKEPLHTIGRNID